jgi:uncharacterized surface protein with fasciclin (FAS1) repeats
MKKKLFVFLFVALAVIMAISLMVIPALAKKDIPKQADNVWCYLPGAPNPEDFVFDYRKDPNDPNHFFTGSYVSDWTGTFTGTSHDNGLVLWHDTGPAVFVALNAFDSVDVGGKSGGLEMYVYGEGEAGDWFGTWFIASASGELEGLEGRGDWWGTGWLEDPDECGVLYYSVESMHQAEVAAPAEKPEVMAPAEAAPVSGNTIVDVAVADGRFDTLVAAITAAGLADDLSGGEWTVFAPTDEAFAKLPAGTVESLLQDPQGSLTDILLYHALVGEVNYDAAVALQGDITMANGQLAGLKVFEDNLYVNDDSKVITADIFTDNGVIHVVDTVILPPWPRTAE